MIPSPSYSTPDDLTTHDPAALLLLCSLPDVTVELARTLLAFTGGSLAWALSAATDPSVDVPGLTLAHRHAIRAFFGLRHDEIVAVHIKGVYDA